MYVWVWCPNNSFLGPNDTKQLSMYVQIYKRFKYIREVRADYNLTLLRKQIVAPLTSNKGCLVSSYWSNKYVPHEIRPNQTKLWENIFNFKLNLVRSVSIILEQSASWTLSWFETKRGSRERHATYQVQAPLSADVLFHLWHLQYE